MIKIKTAVFIAPLVSLTFLQPAYTNAAVLVHKQPVVLERKYFEQHYPREKLYSNFEQDAHTSWTFHCASDYAYDIVDQRKTKTGWQVSLKISSVTMTISLPITVWTAFKAPRTLIQHEFGHVKICRRVYQNADKIAYQCAAATIGKAVNGKGDSIEAACQVALNNAAQDLCAKYRTRTSDVVKKVSEIYDKLSYQKPSGKPDSFVAIAFKKYQDGNPKSALYINK